MSDFTKQLDKGKFTYTRAMMYYSQPKDLTHFNLKDFDMIVLFSPNGVKALRQSFPDLKSGDITIAALGTSTHAALTAAGLNLDIAAPTKVSPSMAMAIENYILGKEQGQVIVPKTITAAPKGKSGSTSTGRSVASSSSSRGSSQQVTSSTGKKPKSLIADKAKYKQLQELRRQKAAERRAERAAAKASQQAKSIDNTPTPEA